MTANNYKKHLQRYRMCETVVGEQAREKVRALDFSKKTTFHTSFSEEGSEDSFY